MSSLTPIAPPSMSSLHSSPLSPLKPINSPYSLNPIQPSALSPLRPPPMMTRHGTGANSLNTPLSGLSSLNGLNSLNNNNTTQSTPHNRSTLSSPLPPINLNVSNTYGQPLKFHKSEDDTTKTETPRRSVSKTKEKEKDKEITEQKENDSDNDTIKPFQIADSPILQPLIPPPSIQPIITVEETNSTQPIQSQHSTISTTSSSALPSSNTSSTSTLQVSTSATSSITSHNSQQSSQWITELPDLKEHSTTTQSETIQSSVSSDQSLLSAPSHSSSHSQSQPSQSPHSSTSTVVSLPSLVIPVVTEYSPEPPIVSPTTATDIEIKAMSPQNTTISQHPPLTPVPPSNPPPPSTSILSPTAPSSPSNSTYKSTNFDAATPVSPMQYRRASLSYYSPVAIPGVTHGTPILSQVEEEIKTNELTTEQQKEVSARDALKQMTLLSNPFSLTSPGAIGQGQPRTGVRRKSVVSKRNKKPIDSLSIEEKWQSLTEEQQRSVAAGAINKFFMLTQMSLVEAFTTELERQYTANKVAKQLEDQGLTQKI